MIWRLTKLVRAKNVREIHYKARQILMVQISIGLAKLNVVDTYC